MKKSDKIFASIVSACVVVLFYVLSHLGGTTIKPPLHVIDSVATAEMKKLNQSIDSIMQENKEMEQKYNQQKQNLAALKKRYIREKYEFIEVLNRYDSIAKNKDTIINIIQCDSIKNEYVHISNAFNDYINQSDSVMSDLYIANTGLNHVVMIQDSTIFRMVYDIDNLKKKKKRQFWNGLGVGIGVTTIIALLGTR